MIPLIDTHQHLIYREISNYSWTKDIPPLAENSFTIPDYKNLTAGLGIGGTIFMESGVDDPDYQKETRFVDSLIMIDYPVINDFVNKIFKLEY